MENEPATVDVESGVRRRPSTVRSGEDLTWPTVDGPLGVSWDEAEAYARRFYLWGFALLPLLWAVNCFYFWPVVWSQGSTAPPSLNHIRPYVVRSGIGFMIFAVVLSAWAITFAAGGEALFGPTWNELVMYKLSDKVGLTGLM